MKHLLLAALWLLFAAVPTAHADDQLNKLGYITGKWAVTSSFYQDTAWGEPSAPMRATADTILGGSFIRLQTPISFPGGIFQFEVTLSYDRFNQIYRMAFIDDLNGYLDVYEGQASGDVISVTNAETGSSFPDGNGGKVIGKLDFQKTSDGFLITAFITSEKDAPYSPYMRLNFTATD